MESIIWIAAIIGTLDLAPQVFKTIKQGHAHGLSRGTLFLFAADKLTNLGAMIHLDVGPLIIKYVIGLICIAILFYFRFRRGV